MAEIEVWRDGVQSEILFWRNWLLRHGGEFREDFKYRFDPKNQVCGVLRDVVSQFFDKSHNATSLEILDVGAGPITVVGRWFEERKLNITAVDALAEFYDQLPYPQIRPDPQTLACKTEELDKIFQPYSFDIVHAQNTLDHHIDAPLAFKQMLHVAKRGGILVAIHHHNEALHGNWSGLHQWNFFVYENDLRIGSHKDIFSLKALLEPFGKILKVFNNSSGDIVTLVQKL